MIVVTGGTGFLGSHLLYSLTLQGNRVRALKRSSGNTANVLKIFKYYSEDAGKLFDLIDWVEGDILNLSTLENAFEGASKVYHLAAFVSYDPSVKKKIFSNNIYGTRNVVNACLTQNVQKLCHVSSVEALGNSTDDEPVNEDMIWNSANKSSVYPISKFQSEMEVWRGIEEGLNAVIVNPSLIIGPGFWSKGIASFFPRINKGLKYYPAGVNGFVDVRDVANIMIKLMDSNISGERFILNSDNIRFEDIFQKIAKAFGKNAPYIESKFRMIKLACKFNQLKSFIFGTSQQRNCEILSFDFNRSFYSNEKIKQRLNYNFIPVEQSIEDTSKLFFQDLINKMAVISSGL